MDTDEEESPRRDPRTYAILGAAFEVHRHLGSGFLEGVYQEALAVELSERSIPFDKERELPIVYKGRPLRCTYRADFVCFDEVIVELKALSALSTREHGQLINYLKATGLAHGLLLNFGTPRLDYKRFILTS